MSKPTTPDAYLASLLMKYPPTRWSPESPAEIEHSALGAARDTGLATVTRQS